MRAPYRTLAEALRFEVEPIKRSRFIVDLMPVSSAEEALAGIAEVRAASADASHHCWAYVLRSSGELRSSDDGEPGGSAGRPILAALQGRDIDDVLAVVTRYFGGTKLGVGGLMRAYGGATARALDRASFRLVTPQRPLWIEHAYDDTAAVEAALREAGLAVQESRYSDRVKARIDVPDADWETLRARLTEATRGRVRFPP